LPDAKTLGLFGGAFDPPHRGHVELLRQAKEKLGLDDAIVLVAADPGHKHVDTPAPARLRLAQSAFPNERVALDDHGRTVDMLRAHPEWRDAVFLVGADEFSDFAAWKEPDEVLRLVRLGVATRPGFPRAQLEAVLRRLDHPDRVEFFELDPMPVASRDLRSLLETGAEVNSDIPEETLAIIRDEGLYTR